MRRANHFLLGVAMGVWVCAGVSGGHVNPAVTSQLTGHRSRSDSMPGDHCFSYLSRISLEESSDLHSRTNNGRCIRRRHRIRGLLPRHQHCGRWSLSQNHRQDGRFVCSLPCASYIMMSAGDQRLTDTITHNSLASSPRYHVSPMRCVFRLWRCPPTFTT